MWRGSFSRTAVLAIAVLACRLSPAQAIDVDGLGGLDTQTVASRDRLRFYDNVKKFGAERVSDRSRAEYAPDGIRVGNYVLHPEVRETVTFDDNIFGTNSYKRADVISALESTLRLQSQFARHSLGFATGAKIINHARNTELDHINAFGQLSGSLHIDHAHTLSVLAFSGLDHEMPSDPGVPQSAGRPVEYWRNRVSVGFTRDVGRVYGTVAGSVEALDYKDTRTRSGAPLDQDGRDTTTYSADLRLGYRFSPGYEMVAKMRGLRQENRGTADLDRDAVGYEAMAGLAAELNPLLRWRLLGGYGIRDYDDANLKTVSSSLLEAQVTWLPTQLVTVYVTAGRAISDTVDTEGAGRIDNTLKGRVEYEIARNLVLSGEVQMRASEFAGEDRQDRTYIARMGVEYWLNKNWMFTFGYEHLERQSSAEDSDLSRNKVSVGAKLRF